MTKETKAEPAASPNRSVPQTRTGSLLGAHPGSVKVAEKVNLIDPVPDAVPDAETDFGLNQ